MIRTQEKASGYNRHIVVSGNKVELLEYCIPKIRRQSQDFYAKNIKHELEKKGCTIIDVHAGMGTFYEINLESLGTIGASKNTTIRRLG